MDLKYKNVTVSGGVAVGKNTLISNLQPYLEPLGWTFTSGGQILRNYLKEYVMPLASAKDIEVHNQIDNRTKALLEKGKYCIEAWLAGFMARERKDTLRVFLYCSNDALRIDRVVNRDRVTIDQAKLFIREREETNMIEWRKIYGENDFWDKKYYHVFIDTYSNGPNETVGKVLDALGFDPKKMKINAN